MRSLVGFTRTGRIQKGPGSDLIEMTAPDGSRHTAIEFHPEYRSHNAINAALGVVLSFLESPMVSGLTDLGAYELAQSVFVYPTGQAWSVAEVVRTLSDLGEVGGVRAGVELLAQAGQILVEAAETGESAGVYSHGGVTPWRVMLNPEGQVQVIGHALPQVEILTFHEQPDRIPREDAFRYCPPERMEARRENFSSDLFGLALVAFEVMCGKPVYDGLVNDIRAKAARGETSRRIHQFREFLPESVRTLLTTTMRPDFRDRFGAGADFFDAVNAALSDPAIEGVSLRDMMQRVIRQQPRARQDLDPGKTSMLSKDQLKKMMEEEEAPAKPQRAAFAPSRPAQPVAAPPARAAEPARPAERPRAEAAPAEPANGALDALGASSSRVGLPPARRPPPRAEPSPESLAPAAASPALPAPARVAPAAASEPPRFGPPVRQGARPNPRSSHAGETPHAAAVVTPAPQAPAPVPPPASPPAEPPRPAVGVARLPPSRRPPPREEAPVEPPADLGRAVPPAPEVGTSGDRARDLLARVRASGNDVTHRPTPSASAVIDRILTSSGSGSSLRDRVARAVQVDQAEPRPEPTRDAPQPDAPRAEAPRVDPPRQEPVLPPPASRSEPPPPPKHPRVEPEPPAPAPAAADRPAPSVVAAAPVLPAALPVVTPVAAPVAAPGVVPSAAPPIAAPPTVPPRRHRVPDALKSNLRGDPVPYKLSRGNGSPVQRRRVPASSTLADVVGLLVGQVVPMRVTTDGRVAGWWRLGPVGGPLPPDTRLDTLDPETPLVFHYVEARTLLLDLEIVGDPSFRLRLPISTAVPAQSLVDALTTMFDLPAGEWVLALDGAPLEPFHVLEDRGVGVAGQLQLRRA